MNTIKRHFGLRDNSNKEDKEGLERTSHKAAKQAKQREEPIVMDNNHVIVENQQQAFIAKHYLHQAFDNS